MVLDRSVEIAAELVLQVEGVEVIDQDHAARSYAARR
jgi:hypothetical protein